MEESEAYLEQLLFNIKRTKVDMFSSFKEFYALPFEKTEFNFYVAAVLNRAIALTDGFVLLAKENNYFSAVPLIRLQVDNSLRLFASLLVADFHSFFLKFLDNVEFKHIRDSHGERMYDGYLVSKFQEYIPGIQKLYKETSGYIHLSSIHSKAISKPVSGKENERVIGTSIGNYNIFSLQTKISFCQNMHIANSILITMLKNIIKENERN